MDGIDGMILDKMTREEVARVVAQTHGWASYPTGRELDTFMLCAEEAEKRIEAQYDALYKRYAALNDAHGSAESNVKLLMEQLAFVKRFGCGGLR